MTILQQTILITRIKKVYDNFENEGDNMSISSCKVWMQFLKNNWRKFEANDIQLYDYPEYNKLIREQPYFRDSIFDITERDFLNNLSQFQL